MSDVLKTTGFLYFVQNCSCFRCKGASDLCYSIFSGSGSAVFSKNIGGIILELLPEYEIFFGISLGENLHSFRMDLILGSNQESFF